MTTPRRTTPPTMFDLRRLIHTDAMIANLWEMFLYGDRDYDQTLIAMIVYVHERGEDYKRQLMRYHTGGTL